MPIKSRPRVSRRALRVSKSITSPKPMCRFKLILHSYLISAYLTQLNYLRGIVKNKVSASDALQFLAIKKHRLRYFCNHMIAKNIYIHFCRLFWIQSGIHSTDLPKTSTNYNRKNMLLRTYVIRIANK